MTLTSTIYRLLRITYNLNVWKPLREVYYALFIYFFFFHSKLLFVHTYHVQYTRLVFTHVFDNLSTCTCKQAKACFLNNFFFFTKALQPCFKSRALDFWVLPFVWTIVTRIRHFATTAAVAVTVTVVSNAAKLASLFPGALEKTFFKRVGGVTVACRRIQLFSLVFNYNFRHKENSYSSKRKQAIQLKTNLFLVVFYNRWREF